MAVKTDRIPSTLTLMAAQHISPATITYYLAHLA